MNAAGSFEEIYQARQSTRHEKEVEGAGDCPLYISYLTPTEYPSSSTTISTTTHFIILTYYCWYDDIRCMFDRGVVFRVWGGCFSRVFYGGRRGVELMIVGGFQTTYIYI